MRLSLFQNTLYAHTYSAHKPRQNAWVCDICGRGYNTSSELRKHTKRHNNPNSIVNKKINEDPSEYKFVCTLHDGKCKKYFKTEKVFICLTNVII